MAAVGQPFFPMFMPCQVCYWVGMKGQFIREKDTFCVVMQWLAHSFFCLAVQDITPSALSAHLVFPDAN